MKKILCLVLALVMCLGMAVVFTACGGNGETPNGEDDGVMSYDEYMAAEFDTKVVVETYVQAKQSWWFNTEKNTGLGTFYMQSPDGAYFVYEMPCTEEEYNTLEVGDKVKIEGYKSEWMGEIEITEATFKKLAGEYIAPAINVTGELGKDSLVNYQNFKVSFEYMTVVAANDAGDAFMYKYNGSGKAGDDIYFKASVGGATYTFVIESYLTADGSAVYEAAEALQVGDVINMEGFLYWYEGAQPHITSIEQVEGISTYADYIAAELDEKLTVITYVQAKQSWWFNTEKNTGLGTFYMQSPDGAYFVYDMPCTEEEYNSLTIGSRVLIEGFKSEWMGEIEITEATFKKLAGEYIAPAVNVTDELSKDSLVNYQNFKISFEGMTVVAANDAGDAFMYKYNGSGKAGDDIYFKASVGGATYTFVIESYLTPNGSAVYEAAEALQVGDVINMEGFLYWYDGAQPHITLIVAD